MLSAAAHIRTTAVALVVITMTSSCADVRNQVVRPTAGGYCALMSDSIGLYQGNSVTRMGVPVGVIERVEPTNTSVRVTFSIRRDVIVPADVKAVTRTPTILADRSMELSGDVSDDNLLAPGNCIPLERTFTAKSISETASAASSLVNQMTDAGAGDTVNRLLAGLSDQLAGNGTVMRDTFTNLASSVEYAPNSAVTDGDLVKDLASALQTTVDNWGTIEALLNTMPGVLHQLSVGVLSPAARIFGPALSGVVRLLLDIGTHYHDILWNTFDTAAATVRMLSEHTGVFVMYAGTLPNILDGVRSFWARLRGRDIPVMSPRVAAGVVEDGKVCSQTDLDPNGKDHCGFFYGVPDGISSVDVLQLVLNGGVRQP